MAAQKGHNGRVNRPNNTEVPPGDVGEVERALATLGSLLDAVGPTFELVVVGGAALNILGFVSRSTKDVDVLGLCCAPAGPDIVKVEKLPPELADAAAKVAADLGLEGDWLNVGPAGLLDWGMPTGFAGRLVRRQYGPRLAVHLPSRIDLICLKVYAAADTGVGRHTDDLRALEATCEELQAGAAWAATHDPSPDFREMLQALLGYFGCRDASDALGG
jgi:hypothetical protein